MNYTVKTRTWVTMKRLRHDFRQEQFINCWKYWNSGSNHIAQGYYPTRLMTNQNGQLISRKSNTLSLFRNRTKWQSIKVTKGRHWILNLTESSHDWEQQKMCFQCRLFTANLAQCHKPRKSERPRPQTSVSVSTWTTITNTSLLTNHGNEKQN